MKKYVALFLIAVTLLTLAACGSKDALPEHGLLISEMTA